MMKFTNPISFFWLVAIDIAMLLGSGTTLDTASLAAGTHTIKATAYDNAGMDLVRYRTSTCPSSWARSWPA
ncbi:MAG: hypothetical protein HC778_07945 [Chamaesiphon sp. CSU_1_12]|nr:hypothetical protein [Chamaesiphon sp. CSU_1_12]